jgi:hypothetical protein
MIDGLDADSGSPSLYSISLSLNLSTCQPLTWAAPSIARLNVHPGHQPPISISTCAFRPCYRARSSHPMRLLSALPGSGFHFTPSYASCLLSLRRLALPSACPVHRKRARRLGAARPLTPITSSHSTSHSRRCLTHLALGTNVISPPPYPPVPCPSSCSADIQFESDSLASFTQIRRLRS